LHKVAFANEHLHEKKAGSFFGASLHLLNLGAVQYFYVPFEPYSTFWGFLPWLLLVWFEFLKKPSKKNTILLAFVNLAAASQSYVQTIFFVYFLCLLIISLIYLVTFRTKDSLKKLMIALSLVIAVNAFWILPQTFFVARDLHVTQNAMQNRMATEKFFQMNKRRGTIENFMVLKEFYYDFLDSDTSINQSGYLMEPWRNHFEKPYTVVIGMVFFLISLYGILYPHPLRKYMIGFFVLASLAFLSDTVIFKNINDVLRGIPLLNQVFRNPFTKFIVPTVFVLSLGFGMGMALILSSLPRKRQQYLLTVFTSLLFILYMFPAFQGKYISPTMRTRIPNQYFDLFDYFKTEDPTSRIMNLPQGGYWGWYYYNWGWRGSGFLWYGIKQPIMDRAFDVWSDELESYYWQLTEALRKNDVEEFNHILEKYQVGFVMYDESLLQSDPFNPIKLAYKQKDLLDNNPKLSLVKKFDTISVYTVDLSEKPKDHLLLRSGLSNILYDESFSLDDRAFEQNGMYKTDAHKKYHTVYPYESLFTSRFPDETSFEMKKKRTDLLFQATVPQEDYVFTPPAFSDAESLLPVAVSARKDTDATITIRLEGRLPSLIIEGNTIPLDRYVKELTVPSPETNIVISINKRDSFTARDLTNTDTLLGSTYLDSLENTNTINIYSIKEATSLKLLSSQFQEPHHCGIIEENPYLKSYPEANSLTIEARNTSVCQVYKNPLSLSSPSLIEVAFAYRSATDEFPRYCFYSESETDCLNRKDSIPYGFAPSLTHILDRFEVGSAQKTVYPQLILEALRDEDHDQIKKITYQDMRVISYPLIESNTITAQEVQNGIVRSAPLELINLSSFTISTPLLSNSYTSEHLIRQKKYKKTPFNYDISLPGEYELLEETEGDNPYIRLQSTKASSYFLTQIYDLPTKYSYYLDVTTRNVHGMPLFMNIFTSKELRNYSYTSLPVSSQFQSYPYIIAPGNYFDTGINILMNSISYTKAASANDINDMSIYLIPYSYLSDIVLKKAEIPPAVQSGTPVQTHKNNLYSTTVTIPQAPEDSTLIFSQSYDPGWIAYRDDSALSFFADRIPHYSVNTWANGWDIKESKNPQTIKLIFWPQYLQFIGFGLLIITLIGVCIVPSSLLKRHHTD
jgi:hypothetical protein